MSRLLSRADTFGLLGAVAIAAVHAFAVVGRFGRGFPGFDVFAYTHPNFLYARDALERGYGVLWNDLQNCGQPFFAIIETALLNPVNALSFVMDPGVALEAKLFVNLAIGAIGAYLLCREIGLGAMAALAGSVAFTFGGGSGVLARSGSFVLSAYAWVPVAAFLCERILRRPSPWLGIGLGVVLTLQLLAGFPQTTVFTYQWIVLRTLWHWGVRREPVSRQVLRTLALGLVLPPLLGAIQLLPSAELAGESIRSRPLSTAEIDPRFAARSAFPAFRSHLGDRMGMPAFLLPMVGVALAGMAFAAARTRKLASFHVVVAGLCAVMAFVPWLFEVYAKLPVVGAFRGQLRFLWMTSFGLSIVFACGVDALARSAMAERTQVRWMAGGALAGLAVFALLAPTGFHEWEWAIVVVAAAAVGAGALWSAARPALPAALTALLFCNLYVVSTKPVFPLTFPGDPRPADSYVEDLSIYRAKAWAFERVAERITPQDRMYQAGAHFDYSLTGKSASIFGIPSITDYEAQTSRRFAEVFVRMMTNAPMTSVNQFYHGRVGLPQNQGLFDLLAARFLVLDVQDSEALDSMEPALKTLEKRGNLRVYENPRALPRAFYVPRAEVIPDPERLLERLASPNHRPRQVALLEEPPADGFLGRPGGSGEATIESSRGEGLVVRVGASQEGFLFVSDQLYPGWEATVEDTRVPVQRANHAFRLVRVPRGESTVTFRYRPASLRAGAAISLISLLGLVVYAIRARGR
jgi:hypothetical protein